MSLKELQTEKPGVGIIRMVCDPPEGEKPTMGSVSFGEYETPDGQIFALTRKKIIGIMKLATTVEQAMLIVNDTAPEGEGW